MRFNALWKHLAPVLPFLLLVLLALACNFPGLDSSQADGTAQMALTHAAQTIQVQLTMVVVQLSQTLPAPVLTATPLPENLTPVATSTPALCDRAGFVTDVTYPDNSPIKGGTDFIKTWRFKNTGTCTWDSGYAIIFERGESMGGTAALPLPGSVAPNQEVDISVSLKAPDSPGVYQGYWMLRNAAGQIFGLGVNADKDFWVKIKVE